MGENAYDVERNVAAMRQRCKQLRLPWPPSVNVYWRRAGKTIHLSDAGRRFQDAVVSLAWDRRPPFAGRLRVEIEMRAPDLRNRDLDNFLKAPLDAMQKAGVYADDSQIDELTVRRGPLTDGGELVVLVTELPD